MFQRVWKTSLVTVNTSLMQICVSRRLTVNHVPTCSFGIVHLFCLNIIWNCSHAMNTCMVLATAMNSWKMYHIHVYSRIDAVILKGGGDIEDRHSY